MNFTMLLPKAVATLGCGLMWMAALPLLASTGAPVLPVTANDWALAAKQDIAAAYQIAADNHPGMANPLDLDFPAFFCACCSNAGKSGSKGLAIPG